MRDRNNDTPLMCAIEFGHTDVILALVECGAHIQVTKTVIKRIILIIWKKERTETTNCSLLISIDGLCKKCSQPPDKPKLVRYARKLDLKSNPFGQLNER